MNRQGILLVEDDPDQEELARRAIKRAKPGISVTVARNGVEALEHLHGPPHSSRSGAGSLLAVVVEYWLEANQIP